MSNLSAYRKSMLGRFCSGVHTRAAACGTARGMECMECMSAWWRYCSSAGGVTCSIPDKVHWGYVSGHGYQGATTHRGHCYSRQQLYGCVVWYGVAWGTSRVSSSGLFWYLPLWAVRPAPAGVALSVLSINMQSARRGMQLVVAWWWLTCAGAAARSIRGWLRWCGGVD